MNHGNVKQQIEGRECERYVLKLVFCLCVCVVDTLLYLPLVIRASKYSHHVEEVVVVFHCCHYCCHCCYASILISVAMAVVAVGGVGGVAVVVAVVGDAVTHLPCKTFALVLFALMPLMNDLQMK